MEGICCKLYYAVHSCPVHGRCLAITQYWSSENSVGGKSYKSNKVNEHGENACLYHDFITYLLLCILYCSISNCLSHYCVKGLSS